MVRGQFMYCEHHYIALRRYGIDGKPLTDAFVIGIGGGSASGKVLRPARVAREHATDYL